MCGEPLNNQIIIRRLMAACKRQQVRLGYSQASGKVYEVTVSFFQESRTLLGDCSGTVRFTLAPPLWGQ